MDAALTRALRPSTVSTSTLLASCLAPKARCLGLLELVHSRYSMLHNSELEGTKKQDQDTTTPFHSYFIVRLSATAAISSFSA